MWPDDLSLKHHLKYSLFSGLLALLVALVIVPHARAVELGNIWPLGDSITYGQGHAGGYRATFYTNLTARGYSFNLVGTLTSNPSTLLTATGQTHHIGHSGYSITNAIVMIVANHRAIGRKIAFVDIHAGLTLADLGDGLHPSASGYVKMGNIWADAVVADPPKFTSQAISVAGGLVTLTASGALHTSYSLQASTNLATGNWTLVTNGNISATPFTITEAVTNTQRFYRFGAP